MILNFYFSYKIINLFLKKIFDFLKQLSIHLQVNCLYINSFHQ
jgi:hypothetical protein